MAKATHASRQREETTAGVGLARRVMVAWAQLQRPGHRQLKVMDPTVLRSLLIAGAMLNLPKVCSGCLLLEPGTTTSMPPSGFPAEPHQVTFPFLQNHPAVWGCAVLYMNIQCAIPEHVGEGAGGEFWGLEISTPT